MKLHLAVATGPLAPIGVAIAGPNGDKRPRRAPAPGPCHRRRVGARLYELTIPGLAIDHDFAVLREALRARFPGVVEVLPIQAPDTVLVFYDGDDEADAWCEALGDAAAARGRRAPRRGRDPARYSGEHGGLEPAA